MRPTSETHTRHAQEDDALLPGSSRRKSRHGLPRAFLPQLTNWKANPYWLLPIVLVASMSRGVTMSPRIQVYKTIACRILSENGVDVPVDCSGPLVQARAARIQASVVTTMNVLSAITTGFWSRLGDVHGRKPVLALFLLGAISMELFYVLVLAPQSLFGRYAENFILAGPILEGLIGGLSAFNGVVHAYTSDCTRHGSRSKIFSTIQGIVFVGLAAGPWFSGLVLPKTATLEVADAFYLSIGLLLTTFIYVVTFCPESRQPTPPEDDISNAETPLLKSSVKAVLRRYAHRFFTALIIPIAMFRPRLIPGQSRKNYNLVLLGAGLFVYLVSTAVYTSKYMYAQHVYSWTTAQLGYYMSLLWTARAFNLLVFLPIVISYLKPKSDNFTTSQEHIAAEIQFDKRLAQASLGLDGMADALVALAPTSSQPTYIGLSVLSSFTSGGNPALHSLGAICLHACGYGSEVGALFGSMAVLSAVAHIISPYIYAITYASTVAFFPKAIFVLASALLTTVVLLLSGINSRPEEIIIREQLTIGDVEEDEEPVMRSASTSSI